MPKAKPTTKKRPKVLRDPVRRVRAKRRVSIDRTPPGKAKVCVYLSERAADSLRTESSTRKLSQGDIIEEALTGRQPIVLNVHGNH